MLRLLHSSDLHLGKRYGRMPEALRGRLTEARHGALERLADAARASGAAHILIAGDLFDAETPAPATLRQGFQAMAADPALTWVILPGNHDSLAADELWPRAAAEAPANVRLALSPRPMDLAPDAVLLPAPCPSRRPGRDLTEWFDRAETPPGALRIGLAHGAVQSFGEEGAVDVLAPDRARRAGLDYLALGDWHGQVRIDARTWYSGTPEPDRFLHRGPGAALAVTLDAPGEPPAVAPMETGDFGWETAELALLPGEDPAARLAAALPAPARRRRTLLRILAPGRARLPERAAFLAAADHAAPDFAYAEIRADTLALEPEAADLDAIDRAGALRDAAEALLAEARDPALPAPDRAAAATALARLHAYAAEDTDEGAPA